MLGCVYVVTTNHYKSKSIFKIGFTTDLTKRLKSFNATRMDDDLFHCVRQWRTTHYSKLEAFLHNYLKEYRKKNEFFETDISRIEEGAELFAKINGPQFFHDDLVLINAELYGVEYLCSKNIFIFADPSDSRIRHANESDMRTVIFGWLECVDIYNLGRFLSSDVVDGLVVLLKQACISKQKRDNEMEDLSDALNSLILRR